MDAPSAVTLGTGLVLVLFALAVGAFAVGVRSWRRSRAAGGPATTPGWQLLVSGALLALLSLQFLGWFLAFAL
jgi:hypothetical protein